MKLLMQNQNECSDWLLQIDQEIETMCEIYHKNVFLSRPEFLRMVNENILILKGEREDVIEQLKNFEQAKNSSTS